MISTEPALCKQINTSRTKFYCDIMPILRQNRGVRKPVQKTPGMGKVPKGNVSNKFYAQFQGKKKR